MNNFGTPQQINYNHTYLEEFGIAKDDPLMQSMNSSEEQRQQSQSPPYDRTDLQNGFIFLPNFHLRPENDGWATVANLDLFFQSLYNYYYHRGLVPIITKGIVELVTLTFTLVLSVFLFVFVDWQKIVQCKDESTCAADFVESYILQHPFHTLSLWNCLVLVYSLVLGLYTIFAIFQFIHTIQQARNAQWVFEERLGISSRKLLGGAIDWDRDVVLKLIALQQSGQYRFMITSYSHTQLDALMIANRIMRKENFMVALLNRDMLNLKLPWLSVISDSFFCSSIEWSLYFCVLNFMFNHKYQVRPAFYLDPAALRRRFQLCGLVHLVFMPFLLFFVTIYFGLQNVYDWKSTKQYLGPREWSLHAKWTFREFNELPHFFERRLSPSYVAAESYLKLFGSNEFITAMGRILAFVGGSLGAVLLGFAAINDAILLHVKIANWNLLWYAGIFGVLFSIGKGMIPKPEAMPKSARNLFAEIDHALIQVAEHTHYLPDTWKGRGWEHTTYAAFSNLFKYKAKIFVTEIVALIVAPYILCVSLASNAESICDFVQATHTEVAGAGDVCGYATFNFDTFTDERWEGRTMGEAFHPISATSSSLSESIPLINNADTATRLFLKPKTRYGKMEKSTINFKDAHPSWNSTPLGQTLMGHVQHDDNTKSNDVTREQDLYRAAAARQLDTLERIEEGRVAMGHLSVSTAFEAAMVDEGYIATQAPADAGAGTFRGVEY